MELFAVGSSNTVSEFRAELAKLPVQTVAQGRLGVLYFPFGVDHTPYHRALREVFPSAPVVGCSTGGAAFTECGVTRSGVVFGMVTSHDVTVEISAVKNGGGAEAFATALGRTRWPPGKAKSFWFCLTPIHLTERQSLIGSVRTYL